MWGRAFETRISDYVKVYTKAINSFTFANQLNEEGLSTFSPAVYSTHLKQRNTLKPPRSHRRPSFIVIHNSTLVRLATYMIVR